MTEGTTPSTLNGDGGKGGNEVWQPRQTCMVLESRIPHTTVNLTFQFEMVDNKLTILWGGDFLNLINNYIL